jgi:hypothetical protein
MYILTGSEEGCKPSDATREADWLVSSLKQIRKQFFLPGRPLAEVTSWPPLPRRGSRLVDAMLGRRLARLRGPDCRRNKA